MTSTDMAANGEPRYFWRRAFAFLLDLIIAQLVVTLLFTALDAAAGTSFRDFSSAIAAQCDPAPADHPQVLRIEGMWPLPAGWERENIVCHYGKSADESWAFTTRLVRRDGTMTYSKEVTYDIDKEGRALRTEFAPNFGPFAIVAFFVAFAARGWRTPGKSVMSLRIVTGEGGISGWRRAMRREFLKLLPLVLFGCLAVWVAIDPPRLLADSEVSIVAMRDGALLTAPWTLLLVGWCSLAIIWCAAPFIVWRGRTWYDALAGTKLVGTDRSPANGPRRP